MRPAEKIDRFSFIQNLPTRHATTVCNFRYINHAPKSESNVRLRYKDGRRLVVATKIINFDDELLIPYWCDESQFDEKRLRKELLDDLKFLGLR